MSMTVAVVAMAALLAFALSLFQARINSRHGTDHAVHAFLINRLRERGGRLFVRIPRLLNEAYVGALPLYLHWIFARFPLRTARSAETLLNPAVNLVHTGVVGLLGWMTASEVGAPTTLAAAMAVVFALTPQFYHALSARNFGLSARSIGLILLTACFFLAFTTGRNPDDLGEWAMLAIACYLVFAFSTFGAQALILMGLVLSVRGHWTIAVGGALGLAVFVAVHPRYSIGYLANTVRFIAAYARELAPRYVLARRFSIWRDIVWDIWLRLRREGASAGLRYAYENSLVIVGLLNPLTVLAAAAAIAGWLPAGTLAAFAADVALAGIVVMLATSLRATRFLGEPERYVEAGAAFAVIGGCAALYAAWGETPVWIVAGVYGALTALQIVASRILSRYLAAKPLRLDDARDAIAASATEPIRCASNNEQYLKLMLPNDWQFSYCIAVGRGYCGMTIDEVFDPFPYPRREALRRIVATYRITHCILDRTRFEDLFDAPPEGLISQHVAFESPGVRVLRFAWRDDALPMSA